MKDKAPTFEWVEIDRRQFLRLAGGALISVSALGLVGCGGSGAGSSHAASGLVTATGTIQFPTGFATSKLKGLTVSNGYGSAKVGSSMSFRLATSPVNPSLAYVQDSTGAVIFVGFVDPTTKTNVLGATSTAIALLHFALDAYMLPASNNAAILTLIEEDPNVAVLASEIGQRVLANPYALNVNDSQISAALKVAVASITGGTTAMALAQVPTHSAHVAQPAFDTPQLLISGGTQSGIDINVDSSGQTTSFAVQNAFRRYGRVYIYETSTTNEAGVVTQLTNAQQIGAPIDVLSTERLNIATALKDIFTTTSPLSPVTSAPIDLAMPGGAVAATFDIIVLGSSGILVEPAFFDESIYAGFVSLWRSDVGTLNLRTAIGDVFFGLILNMVGVTTINAIPVDIDAAVARLEAIGELSGQAAWEATLVAARASASNLGDPINYAALLLQKGLLPSGATQWADGVWEAYQALLKSGNGAASAAVSEASFVTYMAIGFRVILGAITGASLVLGTGDLAAVLKDMMNSHKGDLWSATLAIPPIHLAPTNVTIVPGSSAPVAFTVSPPDSATGPFKWTWTLTGGVSAKLTDEDGHSGTTLTDISATTVYLLTTTLDVNPMALTVKGFFVGTSLTPIGSSTASITSNSLKMSIAPTTPVSLGNQQIYTALVTGNGPSSGLTYQWSLTGVGSLAGGNPAVTTISTVLYTAPTTAGSATLSAKLLDSSQNVLAQASLAIPIVTSPSPGSLTITNSYPSSTATGYNGTYSLDLSPAGGPGSISRLVLYSGYGSYNCVMFFDNGYPGGQGIFFYSSTSGLAGTIPYNTSGTASYDNPGWSFGIPGTNDSGYNLEGDGSLTISNVKDDGTNTSFSFSFTYSNSSGTSIGSGTFIIPDTGIKQL
jgi:hypothetical protein